MIDEMISRALAVAASAHATQVRKGTSIPYIVHPVAVGMILLSYGCQSEVVAAGILHDTVEDTSVTLDDIQLQFGSRVASLVSGASEPDKSLTWEQRKAHTIAYLKQAPLDVCFVVCADKLDNLTGIVADIRQLGEQVWQRFSRGKAQQLWYYRSIFESLDTASRNRRDLPILDEYQKVVEELESLISIEG